MLTLLIILAAIFSLPALLFASYRTLLPILGAWKPSSQLIELHEDRSSFSVGLVTVSHTLSPVLATKLNQFQQLQDELASSSTPVTAIYAGLDGIAAPATDQHGGLESIYNSASVRWISSKVRKGKNHILRDIVRQATTDVLLFSDVDADVNSASSRALLSHLHRGDIGAVTGCRQIHDTSDFAKGQKSYVAGDDRIRAAEMKHLGSVTSSDGKLYAIKRTLINELPADVTDDLYTALGAISSGQRLVCEPSARAIIGRPAKDIGHELVRRRRVTTRGLSTVWRRRALMNPMRTGGYGIGLFINKVLRRLAAPGLIVGATLFGLAAILLLSQQGSGAIFLLPLLAVVPVALIIKSASVRYIALGLVGMSLGVMDFILGKRIESWEPRKQLADNSEIREAP